MTERFEYFQQTTQPDFEFLTKSNCDISIFWVVPTNISHGLRGILKLSIVHHFILKRICKESSRDNSSFVNVVNDLELFLRNLAIVSNERLSEL